MRTRIPLPAAALAALLALSFLPASGWAATYHWNVAGGFASWTDPASWTPARTTPAADDILIFDNGATNTATSVPTQTIGQLYIHGGTWLELRAVSASRVLTIAGAAGADLDVQPSARLTLATANALLIRLPSGTTGSLAGLVTLTGAAHRIQAADVDATVVSSGGEVIATTGFSGSVFGTESDGFTALHSVRFQAGSRFLWEAGGSPFGAVAPNAITRFDHGSRLVFRAVGSPVISGRTYADLEIDVPGNSTPTGSQDFIVDSLIVTQGAFNIALSSTVHLKGSIRIMPGADLQLGTVPAAGILVFDGTAPQRIDDLNSPGGTGGISQLAGHSIRIDNPAGITCSRALDISANLHFLQGVLHFANPLNVNQAVELIPPGTITNASQATGWVHPRVRARISPSEPAYIYPIGTETSYAPLGIALGALTKTVTARAVVDTDASNAWYAQLDPDHKVNQTHALSFDLADTTGYEGIQVMAFHQSADVDPGSNPSNFVMRVRTFDFAPGNEDVWRPTVLALAEPGRVIGAVARYRTGDHLYNFICGEPAAVAVTMSGATSSTEGGAAPQAPATLSGTPLASNLVTFQVALTQPAVDTVTVDYETVDGLATVADGDYVPVSGTLTFAPSDTTAVVSVAIQGDATPERNETVGLELSNPANATILDADTFTTIDDDDDVTAPTVTVLSPNGGESFEAGQVIQLQWTASDDVAVTSVKILLSRDGGSTNEEIAIGVANTGSYEWTVTGPSTIEARLKVIALDDPGHQDTDASDSLWALVGDVVSADRSAPIAFALGRVAPTPTRSTARLSFTLPVASEVRITVHDVAGRLVSTLIEGPRSAGRHDAGWDAVGHAAGVYFVRMVAPGFHASQRIVLIR